MSKQYDLLVFITRAQPFHSGHRRVVELALEQAQHILILVGSSFQARTIKNPFTYDERHAMIEGALDPQHISRMTIRPLRDHLYNDDQWIAQVQNQVDIFTANFPYTAGQMDANLGTSLTTATGNKKSRIGIIGYEKDESSYYLNLFPQWDFIDVGRNYEHTIDATTIREMWLTGVSPRFVKGVLHEYVHDFMYRKFPKDEYDRLVRENILIKQVLKEKSVYKYPIIDTTVDAVVVQSGHILLVQRRSAPGEGLWGIPGGYLNANETVVDGMIRELREETKIKVPEPVLRGSIKASHVFDAPNRSLRGRIITHAHLIELTSGTLPKIKGSDDAAKAQWVSFADFDKMESEMFEDHKYIIDYFLGRS